MLIENLTLTPVVILINIVSSSGVELSEKIWSSSPQFPGVFAQNKIEDPLLSYEGDISNVNSTNGAVFHNVAYWRFLNITQFLSNVPLDRKHKKDVDFLLKISQKVVEISCHIGVHKQSENASCEPIVRLKTIDSNSYMDIKKIVEIVEELNRFLKQTNITLFLDYPEVEQLLSQSTWQEIQQTLREKSEPYAVFVESYVNPVVFIAIMIIGLICNGTLLLIFIRHKEVRTSANTMILNLAVTDAVNVIAGAFLYSTLHFPHIDPEHVIRCRLFTAGCPFLSSLSAFSVLALCIQRFVIVEKGASLHPRSPIMYVFFVWFLAFLLALPLFSMESVYSYTCSTGTDDFASKIVFLFYGVLFSTVLPILMFTFSTLTARKLKKSAASIPCAVRQLAAERLRRRSARVLKLLAGVFVVTYAPLWLWGAVAYWIGRHRVSEPMLLLGYFAKYLLFANGVFNPVALYIASGKFRRLFRKYLFCEKIRRIKNNHNSNATDITYTTPYHESESNV